MEVKTEKRSKTILGWLILFVGGISILITAVMPSPISLSSENGAVMAYEPILRPELFENQPQTSIGEQTGELEISQVITNKSELIADNNDAVDPNCRYGVTPLKDDQAAWISTLNAGWYTDYRPTPLSLATNDAEYIHVVAVYQDVAEGNYLPSYKIAPPLTDAGLGAHIDAQPGGLWIFGNEIEVTTQGNLFPDVYARAYHEFYHYVKDRDPSATVGIGPLAQITPGRLQYLDIMWATYLEEFGLSMPVDVWTYHIYILAEYNDRAGLNADGKVALGTDIALAKLLAHADPSKCPLDKVYCRAEHDDINIFAEQTVALRTWMKQHGQQDKPLILTEYSLLFPFLDYDDPINPTVCYLMDEEGNCFTAERVNEFMNASFEYLETAIDPSIGYPNDNYRLVQQWMWFSLWVPLNSNGGSASVLLKEDYNTDAYGPGAIESLSEMGMNFRNEVLSKASTHNLYASNAKSVTGVTIAPSNTATVTLSVEFYNNGNTSIKDPFQVSFYADQAKTQLIDTTTITPDTQLYGCARHTYVASTSWSGLTPGVHSYWVDVDSGNAITETNLNDNVATGIVIIDPDVIYLPIILRD